jgi:hypothetical protein
MPRNEIRNTKSGATRVLDYECRVSAVRTGSIDLYLQFFYGQATKGVRWMPRQREAMKDVVSCDKLRLAAKQALTRRFPNGETHWR